MNDERLFVLQFSIWYQAPKYKEAYSTTILEFAAVKIFAQKMGISNSGSGNAAKSKTCTIIEGK